MRFVTTLCILFATISAAYPQAAGSISGSVADELGAPKSGVWVAAIRTTVPPAKAVLAIVANPGWGFQQGNCPECR